MKILTKNVIGFLSFLGLIYLLQIIFLNYFGEEVAVSSSGNIASPSDCNKPETEYKKLFCAKRFCKNLFYKFNQGKRIILETPTVHSQFSNDPDLIEVVIKNPATGDLFLCVVRSNEAIEINKLDEKI